MRMTAATRRLLLAGAIAMIAAPVAHAQRGMPNAAGEGYLFGEPWVTLSMRLGYAQPLAQSDLFTFATSEFTLRRRDFGAFEFGVDVGIPASRSVEWLLSVDASSREAASEYRQWTGSDGLPIAQSTTFKRVPVLLGARWWLRPPGESVGALAWVPNRFAPFVALQGGLMYYQFAQKGEFVNFSAGNAVFQGDLGSDGWAPAASATVGALVNLNAQFGLLTQARYTYASKTLGPDFTGFQPIDLSGLSVTAGFTFRLR